MANDISLGSENVDVTTVRNLIRIDIRRDLITKVERLLGVIEESRIRDSDSSVISTKKYGVTLPDSVAKDLTHHNEFLGSAQSTLSDVLTDFLAGNLNPDSGSVFTTRI